MSNRATQPAIRGWQSQPPAGGWPFTYHAENGQRFPLKGFSAQQVVDNLNSILKLNSWFISDSHTWAIANGVWTTKDPERSIAGAVTIEQLPAREEFKPAPATGHRPYWDTKPDIYGRNLWMWIHTFGCMFDKDEWMMTIRHISHMLDPHHSPSTGCAKCHSEWQSILRETPSDMVNNEQDAAAWTFAAHNRVNAKIGKMPMTWRGAARMHSWKV